MSEYRTLVERMEGQGMAFEVYEFTRKAYGTSINGGQIPPATAGAAPMAINLHVPAQKAWRQVRMELNGGSGLLEPGALQYAQGNLQVEVQKLNAKSNIFTRALASAGTGESGFATSYRGHGDVWTEPTFKHFIVANMDGPQDALLLDDQAFYACEGSISLKTHMHNTVQGVLSGAGLMQPKLEGRGVFIVESPVPVNEIEEIDLDGSGELIVDGDLMLMYSANLQVELTPLVRGLRNLQRSGEGLVYKFRGKGKVWITPTVTIGV